MKSKFDPQKRHRRSIRLKNYDYASQGAYYVTIVVQGRQCLFGEIIEGEMHLSKHGEIVQNWWNEIPMHFPNVKLGAFVIMPNHVHGIILITDERRGEVISPPNNPYPPLLRPALGQIVAYFKYQSTKEINSIENTGTIAKVWQRNYYEHIIRNERDLQQKTDYILNNPSRWEDDREYPNKKSPGSR
ncbi:MAG TPA: transposase [Anaerolineales bacterium]|nr:transposase [Anaerolineales bacterium]